MQETAQPRTVACFETLSLAVVAAQVALIGPVWVIALWAPIVMLIVLGVTRRRSSRARWIFTILHALLLVAWGYLGAQQLAGLADANWAAWLLAAAAIVQLALLWSPATSRWLSSKREPASPTEAGA